jgi:hypothetical protein
MPAKACLHDLVGNLVVYRSLDPVDARLPRYVDAWEEMGMPGPITPRKSQPNYARAVTWLIKRARALHAPNVDLAEIIYVGDTAMNDGNAFRNLRNAGGWQGYAFIGSDRTAEYTFEENDGLCVANRWRGLSEFAEYLQRSKARLDPSTVVILDIDETLFGARGRNDRALVGARVAAAEGVAMEVLGSAFNSAAFREAYAELNRVRFHPFTADNQDNLVYICLMLSSGIVTLEELREDLASGLVTTYREFMAHVDELRTRMEHPAVRAVHDDVYARVQAGDATPFKAFRQREYLETVSRLGHLPDRTPASRRLEHEICMTQEVHDFAQWLGARNCLVMALSDKPDLSTMPTAKVAALGYQPLHWVPTHLMGDSIAGELPEA